MLIYKPYKPESPFGLLTKDLPKAHLKPHWRSLLAVAKKLGAIRKSKIVDIIMDQETRHTIVDSFKACPSPVIKPCALGMDYVAITVDGVEMRLVWHGWFDSMRVVSLSRGRRIRALALDFSDCWTETGVPIFKKLNHHRIILFK